MLDSRENIRFINFDSIIVLTIVYFCLLIFSNSSKNTTKLNNIPVPAYLSVSESIAVISPCIRLQVYQKTWILNKDNFNLLAFNRNPISESKKTKITVAHLQIIRGCSDKIPLFFIRYHLFPDEDLPPDLS
jgi:hypothetical protein